MSQIFGLFVFDGLDNFGSYWSVFCGMILNWGLSDVSPEGRVGLLWVLGEENQR